MRPSFRSILITGILAISANSLLIAQTNNPWFEGWYRAKFGRPSPTEEARIKATEQAKPTPSKATAATTNNIWFENWYRDKFGRPSPTEEARLESQRANKALTETKVQNNAIIPANTWFENWYRDKYGRPSPQEEARLKGLSR